MAAYDPKRPRPAATPADGEPAPVEALLEQQRRLLHAALDHRHRLAVQVLRNDPRERGGGVARYLGRLDDRRVACGQRDPEWLWPCLLIACLLISPRASSPRGAPARKPPLIPRGLEPPTVSRPAFPRRGKLPSGRLRFRLTNS